MSEIDDAIARLERAVTRLETASSRVPQAPASDERTAAVALEIAQRIDAALARLGTLLEREG
jgi:hypothetical protein